MNRRFMVRALIGIAALLPMVLAPAARAQGTVIASDNFNRANESPFAVGGSWGRTIAGNYDGNSNLTGNQVTSVFKEGIYYWQGAGTFNPARQFARQRVVQKNGELGLVLCGGPQQSIMVAWGPPGVGDTVYIYWYSNGVDRGQLATGPATLVNGDIIEAVLDNGIIYAKVNGVTVKSVANTTTLTTGTPGFITYFDPNLPTQVSILDDWEAGTPVSYTIGGTITENAAGLSGVSVTASGGFSGNATTDVNGAYTISGVPSGATSIVLTPTLGGHTMNPLNRTVAGPVVANVTGENFTSTQNLGAALTTIAVHGTVTRNPDQATYTLGTQVTLTPVPDGGYQFSSWSGDVPVGQENANPLQVTMNQDRTITAHFFAPGAVSADHFDRPDESPLVVGGDWQKVLSGGFVNLANNHVLGASNDAVYYWQGAGSFDNTRQFARSRVVSAGGQVGLVLLGANNQGLVVAWGGGRLYIYWYLNGSHHGELANIAAPLADGDEIEAVLDQGKVYAKRNGVVVTSVTNTTSLTSGKPGFETYQTGAIFDDWEAGTPPVYSISGTITENATGLSGVAVTASGGFSGSTATDIDGAYTISGVPAGLTSVLLTPTLFGHTMTPPNRTVTGPLTGNVTGQDFTSAPSAGAILTIFASHGSVTRVPDLPAYPFGSDVALTPVADPGYQFLRWTGDVPAGHEYDNPLHVTMNQDRTITAVFMTADVVAADDFNRANEFPLIVGGNWQRPLPGGLVNLSGQQVAGANNEALYNWQGAGAFSTTEQFARVRVVQSNGQVGLLLLGAPNQALVVAWNNTSNGGTLYIYWYNNGSYQGNLTTVSSTIADGDIIEARLTGGIIYAKINDVTVASVPNTTTLAWGKPGFETFLTGAIFDDWQAGPPPCGVEVCDNVDNDCDGSVDEGNPGGGGACVTGQPGVCAPGILQCTAGALVCVGNASPSTEICNALDDDCDGSVDEGTLCNDGDACTTDACQAGTCVATPLSCDDGYPCTDDSCNPATGCEHTNNTAACDDGNACTTGDVCGGGTCAGAGTVVCNDNNPCTDDSCNPATGCQHVNNTTACDDGNVCTTGDTCGGGSCQPGVPVVCNDGNVCTDDACYPEIGCAATPNFGPCDDGNACTTGDACGGGEAGTDCVPGTPADCNDNNPCTDDSCNPATGCTHTNNTASCDDGNACTTGDVCGGGTCAGGTPVDCNDDNPCTLDGCNPATGCTHVANSAACDDNNPCTDDTCNPATGCEHTNNTASCDDGNACTTGDACSGGTCAGGTPVVCNDHNPCTDDVCHPATGCAYTNNEATCDDGNNCTTVDTCSGGECVGGSPINCSDGNPCTDESCDSQTGCVHTNNTASCDDGNACTTGDVCGGGVCTGGAPVDCNDNNPCTDDSCNPATGCAHANNTAPCDDGTACTTGDVCDGGICTATPVDCDDANACTADTCNPLTGCEHVDDPASCNDNNPCTDDTCHPTTGCGHTNNTGSCDDGNACTSGDVCGGGACAGVGSVVCSDNNPCTDDSCNPATGCVYANNTAACDDGSACTTGDACGGGSCAGAVLNCNDNNGCTDDSCNPATGCVYANNTASCTDNNACTTGDVCGGGSCQPGTSVVCNDGNGCTDDSCNPATGCVYTNNTASCSDGNACTTGDVCGGGVCAGGAPVVCGDGNVCTTDSCNPATGCVFTNNTASCSDGNACTTGDTCSSGACVGGAALNCNDNNVCTTDSCNPATGCAHANNTIACNDGNACTTGDVCGGGTCTGATPVVCNDTNVCTNDSCNPATGCVFVNNTIACDDGSACTTADTCHTGVCVGVPVPPPAEVQGVSIASHPTKVTWTAVGGALAYDVASATLSSLRASGTPAAACLANDRTNTSFNDNRSDPVAGDGYYYLIRAQATCGPGSYGIGAGGAPRVLTACP